MFTRQIPDLVRQLRGHVPDAAVTAFESLLGNGAASLEHRGPVQVEIDGNFMPGIYGMPRGGPLGENCYGTATAAITAINRAGQFTGDPCTTDCVTNGLAFRAIGPSQLDSARIENLFVGSLQDLCGNPIEGITSSGGQLSRFIVTDEAPSPGDPNVAFGKIVTWNGAAYVQTGSTIALVDFTPTNEFSSRWRNNYYGWCTTQPDRISITISSVSYPVYEVVWVESKARYVEFVLTSAMASQRANANVLFTWGADDHADPPATISVYDRTNRMAPAGIGFRGVAVYDEQAQEYIPLHSLGSIDIVVGAPPPDLVCLQITNGVKNGSCLFEGQLVTYSNPPVPDFCVGSVWTAGASVWVFAPNSVDTDIIRSGNIYFAMQIDPAFNLGGDIRPLYLIKEAQDSQIVFLKFEDAMRRADCTYPAKRVLFPGTDYCVDASDDEEDVYVYLPNSGTTCKDLSGVHFSWGKLLMNDYNGRPLYLSKLDIRNCRALFAIVELSIPLNCADSTGDATFVDFIEQGEHKEPWDTIGAAMTFSNRFKLCGETGKKALVMLNEDPGEDHLLIQVEHTCVDVVVGVSPSPPCSIQVNLWHTAVMKYGEVITNIDLEEAVCDCCG